MTGPYVRRLALVPTIEILTDLFKAVSWSIAYVDMDNSTLVDFGTNKNNTVHWNVYRDVKAVPEERNSTIYDMTGQFRVDNVTESPIGVLGSQFWTLLEGIANHNV